MSGFSSLLHVGVSLALKACKCVIACEAGNELDVRSDSGTRGVGNCSFKEVQVRAEAHIVCGYNHKNADTENTDLLCTQGINKN